MGFTFTDEDTKTDFCSIEPGEYVAEVSDVKSTKGDSLMLVYKSAETGDRLCNDFLHFTDKSKGITAQKLKILGLEKNEDGQYYLSDDGMELVGKRVSLTLVTSNDPKYLEPDFNSEGFGYSVDDIGF
jgi:hypothetical protein